MVSISNSVNCNSAYNIADKNSNSVTHNLFKSRPCFTALLIVASVTLSGCSLTNSQSKANDENSIITGSINKQVRPEGLSEDDAERIKNAVLQIGPNGENTDGSSSLMAWSNPETGNTGTITAIDNYIGIHGQSCKKFRTTVDSFMGIALYNGETCELRKGFWVLSWFIRDAA